MEICFHRDQVNIADVCRDLKKNGAVYWHTSRPNFRRVLDLIVGAGCGGAATVPVNIEGQGFLNYVIRCDLMDGRLDAIGERVFGALSRWLALDEPVTHIEPLCQKARADLAESVAVLIVLKKPLIWSYASIPRVFCASI